MFAAIFRKEERLSSEGTFLSLEVARRKVMVIISAHQFISNGDDSAFLSGVMLYNQQTLWELRLNDELFSSRGR